MDTWIPERIVAVAEPSFDSLPLTQGKLITTDSLMN